MGKICVLLLESPRGRIDWFVFLTTLTRTESPGVLRPCHRTAALQVNLRYLYPVDMATCKWTVKCSCLKQMKDGIS